jgi:uncharacterized repeat protein (TIGR03843 family)
MQVPTLLCTGEIEILGRMPYSSNGTFLVDVRDGAESIKAIYKPLRGERPLWDFPSGLYRREIAAYCLSESLGMHIVPPTVERDGPLGLGSLQQFVDARFEEHYFTLFESHEHLHDQFRSIAVFDIVANNTDRKSGHCLVDAADKVWAIDNGLCFSVDFKLRTVIWEFSGEPIAAGLLDALCRFVETAPACLSEWLDDDEIEAAVDRARILVTGKVLPSDPSGQRYPWPMV